jgi:hypothetical protein
MRALVGQVVVDGLSHGEADFHKNQEIPGQPTIEMISKPEPVAALWA